MKKVRWGLVGSGGIGNRTMKDLLLCDDAVVTAICSREQESADAFAKQWGLSNAFSDFDKMCASDQLDAIYIGTPHATHHAYAKRALTAGKHVLCEKPLTMTAAEAQELGDLAKSKGVFLMEAMWMKFTPGMQKAMELIQSGVIGDAKFLQGGLGYAVPKEGPKRYWDPALGGGALYDMGIYTVTLAQMTFGEVKSVTASGDMRPDGVDLHEAYLLHFETGTAQLVNSITFMVPPKGWIGGTKGSIDLSEPLWSPRSLKLMTGQPPVPPEVKELTFEIEGAGYVPMFRAVNASILAGETEQQMHPISATVQALKTLELIRETLLKA